MTVGGACLVEVVLFKCCRVSVLVVVFLWIIVVCYCAEYLLLVYLLFVLYYYCDCIRAFYAVCVCN